MNKWILALTLAAAGLIGANANAAPEETENVAEEMTDDSELESAEPSYQRIVINVPARELHFVENDKLVKSYKVAVGEPNFPSPLGRRQITSMTFNPWWIPPKHQEWAQEYQDTPPGAENPMGPVKMDIGDLYFIHGNNDPISIGHAVTHGCVRLLDEEALEVANRLLRGSGRGVDKTKLASALSSGKENYRVALDRPVTVDLIYDLVEVKDNKIYVYKDVYDVGGKTQKMIEDELVSLGVPEDKIRRQLLKRDLKFMKNRPQLELSYERYVKNFDKEDLAMGTLQPWGVFSVVQ